MAEAIWHFPASSMPTCTPGSIHRLSKTPSLRAAQPHKEG